MPTFPRRVIPAVQAAVMVGVGAAIAAAATSAARGPGFSFAGSLTYGYVALAGPALVCLAASVARIWRHPDRVRAGVLVAGAGVAWVAAEWDNPSAGSSFVFSLGLACFAAASAAVLHLGLASPHGRLVGRPAVCVVALGYAVTVGIEGVASALWFDPAQSGCPSCPQNLWNVPAGAGARVSSLGAVGVQAGLVWALVAVLAVALTAARAGPVRRRVEGPRWLCVAAFTGLSATSYSHSLGRGFLGADSIDRRIWVAQALALTGVGFAVLSELLRERRTERALARVVVDLSDAAGSLRSTLAARLGDPDLQLAFPVDHGTRFVDAWARPVDVAATGGRVVTPLVYGGETLASLVHRPGILSNRESVEDLVATIHLGLDHQRLQAVALAQVEELRASGVRLVETGDEERRRIERDLHDGAQQRLVGLALGMRLLGTRTGGTAAVEKIAAELEAAIDDLRALARGLSPLVLSDAGLAAAVRALAESREIRVEALPNGRFPQVVESTAYLLVDRASSGSTVKLRIEATATALVCCVVVIGALPDLGDLADRTTTLGGDFGVTAAAGGSLVSMRLPTTKSPLWHA